MSVRRTIGLIVLTNLLFVAALAGFFYFSGAAAASPAAQGEKPLFPPVSLQFPLYQTSEDLVNTIVPPLPGAPTMLGTFYQSYAGSEFHRKSTAGVKTASGDAHCIYADESSGNPIHDPMVVPVQMPQGAIVTQIVLYYWRGGTDDNANLELKRSNMQGTVDTPATLDGTGGSDYASKTLNLNPTITVDNGIYAYFLAAKLNHAGAGMKLCGARIAYNYTVGTNFAETPIISNNAP
jgi:hypothetical protein